MDLPGFSLPLQIYERERSDRESPYQIQGDLNRTRTSSLRTMYLLQRAASASRVAVGLQAHGHA